MKRILVVLALVVSMQVSNAQVKSVSAAKSAVESAQKASEDAKKATKCATWMKLGQTLVDAYDAPKGDGWIGASKQELQLVMGSVKPLSEEQVEINGQQMTKDVYDTKNYYFSDSGVLQIIEVTSPIYPDALDRAVAAFKKAAELDSKGQKTEEIQKNLENIVSKYNDEAYAAYSFGKFSDASVFFEKAAKASMALPSMKVSGEAFYNAGFTANAAGELDRAKEMFETAIANGYEGESGDCYAKIADILSSQGKKEESKDVLEAAFVKYPQSQSILIGLINYYNSTEGDPSRLFELINMAKKNEPNNAALYYVEGNIHKQLGEEAAALEAYDKCAQVNPKYPFGEFGKGVLYYEKALSFQEQASSEMDDAKWNELSKQFEEALKSCIPPFEKAFEISDDDEIKSTFAEYLKNACFRFRTESQEYADKYEKYSKFAAGE